MSGYLTACGRLLFWAQHVGSSIVPWFRPLKLSDVLQAWLVSWYRWHVNLGPLAVLSLERIKLDTSNLAHSWTAASAIQGKINCP